MIFATGIVPLAANTNFGNDIVTQGGTVSNLAESVFVEARTRSGHVFNLPVEFAGAQGQIAQLDQVNAVVSPELRGAGTVEITIVAGGQRSNTTTINIR